MRLLKEIRSLIGSYHVKSGVFHYYRREYKQAADFFKKALNDERSNDADQRNARHYLTLSLIQAAEKQVVEGSIDNAIGFLLEAAEFSPSYPDIRFRLGQLYADASRTDEAIAAFQAALERSPKFVEGYISLGFCLLKENRGTEAGEAFQQALKLRLENLERPVLKGISLVESGDAAQAADLFHEAFRTAPALAERFRNKALAFLAAEEYERALEWLDRALELNPKYPDLHNYRGVSLCELERLEEAIEAFKTSYLLGPRNVVPRLNQAFALIRDGQYRAAEGELEVILKEHPEEPAALAKLEELRAQVDDKRRPISRGTAR